MQIYIDGSKRHAVSRMFPVWERLGHTLVDKPKHADVQLSVVRISNNTGLPTVLRLDGIYYDAATNYNKRNISISNAHMKADALIYQSNTSKLMCEKYLGERLGFPYVIHNGINPSGWNMPIPHQGINVFCCGKWRRPKRLEETVEVFGRFLKHYPDAKLHVIGGFKKGGKEIKHENVVYHGQVEHDKMQELYRTGDMFLQLCKKDSCPSTVVEAIAAGMPVLTTNACGGATEMVKIAKNCVVITGESESLEPDFIYEDAYNKMPEEVMQSMTSLMMAIALSGLRAELPYELTIDYTAREYLGIMGKVAG